MFRKSILPRSTTDERLLAAAARRVRKVSTDTLLEYADAAVVGIDKGLQDFREHGDLASLADIGLGLLTLQALTFELKERRAAQIAVETA